MNLISATKSWRCCSSLKFISQDPAGKRSKMKKSAKQSLQNLWNRISPWMNLSKWSKAKDLAVSWMDRFKRKELHLASFTRNPFAVHLEEALRGKAHWRSQGWNRISSLKIHLALGNIRRRKSSFPAKVLLWKKSPRGSARKINHSASLAWSVHSWKVSYESIERQSLVSPEDLLWKNPCLEEKEKEALLFSEALPHLCLQVLCQSSQDWCRTSYLPVSPQASLFKNLPTGLHLCQRGRNVTNRFVSSIAKSPLNTGAEW